MRIISDEEFKEVFVAENIMGRLINKNVNREWLSGIPHRTFLDMYIIYQVDISVLFNQPDYVQILKLSSMERICSTGNQSGKENKPPSHRT